MLIVDERNACKFEKERLILYSCSPVGTTCRLDMIACKQTNSSGQIRIEKNWWIVDWKKKKDLHQVVSSKFSLKEFHSTSQSFRVLTLHFNFACNQPSMDCEFVIDRKWALFFKRYQIRYMYDSMRSYNIILQFFRGFWISAVCTNLTSEKFQQFFFDLERRPVLKMRLNSYDLPHSW